ncbi:hypothetical protein [Paenibacillus terricola]|uniref:hypothetical protein n=1 Tax=Paenibacillus terricola TaxID=2763503 RepID=UPI0029650127|nr:hypothetical protein [Paenibacillus terricola]
MRAKKRSYWNTNVTTKERWQEQYKDVTFDIDTHVNVRRWCSRRDRHECRCWLYG